VIPRGHGAGPARDHVLSGGGADADLAVDQDETAPGREGGYGTPGRGRSDRQPYVPDALKIEPVARPAARGQRYRSLTPGGGFFSLFLVLVSAGSPTKNEVAP
jgi:hypothetical protein